MPLKSGSSNIAKSKNIKELMKQYKETGKIGTSTPKNKEKAHKQAVAIAMSEAEKSKKKKKAMTEAIEQFIDSLKTPKTESFLENVVKRGMKLCFEGLEEPMMVYGHSLQYDPAEGKYYEQTGDRYLEHDEYQLLRDSDDKAQRKYKELLQVAASKTTNPREINDFIQGSHLHWNQDSARALEDRAMKLLNGTKGVFEDATISQDATSDENKSTILDTNKLTANEIDVMQTELDKVKMQKADIEKKNTDLEKTQQELQKTTQAMTLNKDENNTI